MPFASLENKKEYNRLYRLKNKEYLKEKNKEWVKNHKEYLKDYRKEHYTGIYGSWYAMKQRCGNKNHKQYKDYGCRGITFCDKWIDFVGFKKDMECGYKRGLTIERIDNDGNYCKENCKWETRFKQCRNKRDNVILEFEGQAKTMSEWAEILKISPSTISARYRHGWSIENILSPTLKKPVRDSKTKYY